MEAGSVKGVLLDLSGTIYSGGQLITGAAGAIQTIREAGLPLLFVTNTTSKPRSRLVAKLEGFGLKVAPSEIFTAPLAAGVALQARHVRRCYFLLPDTVIEDFPGMTPVEEEAEAVVIGDLGEAFDYDKLNHAFRMILNGIPCYALANNRFFEKEGSWWLDVGPFVAALEYATGTEAELLGKPAATFYQAAAGCLGLPVEDVAMVGDDVEADVGGAMDAGLRGILVRTGKYRKEWIEKSEITPSRTLASIAELPAALGIEAR